jgi:hypothetical protein
VTDISDRDRLWPLLTEVEPTIRQRMMLPAAVGTR